MVLTDHTVPHTGGLLCRLAVQGFARPPERSWMICTGALVGLMIDIQPWVSDRKLGRQGPSELGAVSFAQMKPRKVGTSTSSCLHDGLGMTSGPIPFLKLQLAFSGLQPPWCQEVPMFRTATSRTGLSSEQ